MRSPSAPDLLARVGGDEFAVLLRHTDGDSARRMSETLRQSVQEALLGSVPMGMALSASIGMAQFGDGPAPSQDELFARADAAMYEMKRRTRPI